VVYHSHLETPLQSFDRYLRGAFALERVMPRAFRHRLPVLALDATLGAFADVLYCLKTNQAEWSSYALKRRLARAFGRLLGARPWLMKGLYELNKLLAVPTLRLTQLAGFAQSPLHPKHLTRSQEHLWYLPFASAGEKALDMGAGSGLHSLVLAQQGLLVFAADYNASGLKALQQTAARLQRPPLPLVCNAERPWPFKPEVFDLVLLLDSLEHLHAPELALAEAWRTLKPGGLLLATLPNRDTHWKLARRRVGVFDKQDPDHKHEYTLQEATDLLEAAGFTLLAPPEPITADLPAWSLVALASALWPVLYERLGNWKRRLARRFPRETTGWRFVAQKEAGHQ
jgi:SAM-dependent methyltransferase